MTKTQKNKYKYILPAHNMPAHILPAHNMPAMPAIIVHILPAIALLFALMPAALRAQESRQAYTITNGHYYWFDGTEGDSDAGKYLTGYDKNQGWAKIYTLGTHASHASTVTEIVEQGTLYLRLDISTPTSPAIVAVSTASGFDPKCVWYRTSGSTGYYYQTWDGYSYYLVPHPTLHVERKAENAPVSYNEWYDWDHGLAIQDNGYFWVIYDDLNDEDPEEPEVNPVWRMSTVSCYQRPDEIIYENYRADGAGGNTWDAMYYYDNVAVGPRNYAAGTAATYIQVTVTDYQKSVPASSSLLHSVDYTNAEHSTHTTLDGITVTYDETCPLTIIPTVEPSANMTVTPAYTEYVEETYRRGIHLQWAERTADVFGRAGVPTLRNWYYYDVNNDGTINYTGTEDRATAAPGSHQENATLTSVTYTLDSRASRYLRVTPVGGTNNATLTQFDRPMSSTTGLLICTAEYSNGVSVSDTSVIYISHLASDEPPANAKNAPVVRGSVFGGGRMANVVGNTSVVVHNTDSIYALYGGNDIAGWVQGEKGANVQIGTRHTNEEHPVHIGWVYGGGCGYYTYQGLNVAQDDEGNNVDPYVLNDGYSSLIYSAYFFNGKVYKWNTVPSDYETYANQVVERFTQVELDEAAGQPHTYTDAEIMEPYYQAAWDDADLVVDQVFSYIPYYYCNESTGETRITFDENPENVDNTEDGNGASCMANKDYLGTIPYVKTAHVTIGVPEVSGHNDAYGHNAHEHNDYILIDSVFGGAENAFIGVTTQSGDHATAVTLDINGGTVLAAFGGNNFGGAVANTATTVVNVNCTKLNDDMNLTDNTYYSGYGRGFGIRHLFGGGNMVESSSAILSIHGGQTDTAFVGGNRATVKNPIGVVECRRDGTTYDSKGRDGTAASYQKTPENHDFQNGHFIYTNSTMYDPSGAVRDTTNNGYDWEGYVPNNGLFNVHYLYGGNNKATMENVAFVQLHSGGVGSVYGGGCEGDMNNDKTIYQALSEHSGYLDISPLLTTLNNILARSTLVSVPQKISAMVAANEESQIIVDYVYGGCRRANVTNTCGVYVAGGDYGHIFGGNDVSGDVGSNNDAASYMIVTGKAVVQGNVYGGCDGFYRCEKDGKYSSDPIPHPYNPEVGNDPYSEFTGVLLPTQQHACTFINGGLIKGNVVAGGSMANVGFDLGTYTPEIYYGDSADYPKDPNAYYPLNPRYREGIVRLEIADTAVIYGNVFGGGANASIFGLSQVYVHGTPIIYGSLFAGNDCVGSIKSFLPFQSNLDKEDQPYSYFNYYYNNVYSGGALASHSDSLAYMAANMTGPDSTACERANLAAEASSSGDLLNELVDGNYSPKYSTYVRIEDSPIINSVYGSGNGAWNYDGDPESTFPDVTLCANQLQLNSRPNQSKVYVDINTSGGFIDTVFGGGAGCTVQEDVVVLINNTDTVNGSYPDATTLAAIKAKSAELGRTFVGGTSRSEVAGTNFVGTVFGGNNFEDMNTVPEIRMVMGNVKNVYGGGNAGNMTSVKTMKDICDNDVEEVSTHILVQSENITVTDSVFGGCRMSDIEGTAFVEIRKTTASGIQYLYGGNDISGKVGGNTRIDVSGGLVRRIWGGSNGYYDYVPAGLGMYDVYYYGTYDSEHPENNYITRAAKPNIDSTHINLWGGTIAASVFTGGSMADCNATCLVVNDLVGCPNTGHATVIGALYGGGEGRWDDLNAVDLEGKRWGNVNGNTNVHLYHADNVTEAKAYGGGGGGDVENTYITTYDTWNSPFVAMFGGCWGSDVHGTAHLTFNGEELVNDLYGGNDFTGYVHRTEMVVNSGRFTNIYGGGNGNYPDSYYVTQHADALLPQFSYQNAESTIYGDTTIDGNLVDRHIDRPNTEYINMTFNSGIVYNNLYGGGEMGTTWRYERDGNGDYVLDTRKMPRPIADTNTVHADPTEYAYIITNIHGGDFRNNVYAGASGKASSTGNALIYGLKVLNMDNGDIHMSLYGGSESVNDGYANECKGQTETTMRPSSILNITGGNVESNLYGAGYLGMTHGSVYVNVGTHAIDTCLAYVNTYDGGAAGAYEIFMPGAANSLSDNLVRNDVSFGHSIYAGANWGSGGGSAVFDQSGFKGGESRIFIDGLDYNTANDALSAQPQMNITKSIFGSGTSVRGGDIISTIDLHNYGSLVDCHPTRELESVQRADKFQSRKTAVHYLGATNAMSAYISEPYSVLNIRNMEFRGYNVAEYDAAVDHVYNLYFYKEDLDGAGEYQLVSREILRAVETDPDACTDHATICSNTAVVSPNVVAKQNTLLIINNGVEFTVRAVYPGETPGRVYGYGYVTTPIGYSSSVTAQATAVNENGSYSSLFDPNDPDEMEALGLCGFMSPCDDSNQYTADRGGIPMTWVDHTAGTSSVAEFPYDNYTGDASGNNDYREWEVGKGIRLRETAILAHSDPSKLAEDVAVTISDYPYALAEAYVSLPATNGGHYYKLNAAGVNVLGLNSTANLTDKAWYTAADFTSGNPSVGNWVAATSVLNTEENIQHFPNNTFGLLLVPDDEFTSTMPTSAPAGSDGKLVLNANSYVSSAGNYYTPTVDAGIRVQPKMKFILTYNPEFTTTFLGTVDFTLDEYDEYGNLVGPVQIKAYISTIMDEFRPMSTNVLAMFNNGTGNTFTRKVILPITIDENRVLYITSIKWEPTDGNGNSLTGAAMPDSNRFWLVRDPEQVTDTTPHSINNIFGLSISPNDAVSSELNENLGWSAIDEPDINLYPLGVSTGSAPKKTPDGWDVAGDTCKWVSLINSQNPYGLKVGTLDGRGSAAINVNLAYDGTRVYPKTDGLGYVGKAVLGMQWRKGMQYGNFTFTIYVKTREHGDTIYVATADEVERGAYTVRPYGVNPLYLYHMGGEAPAGIDPLLVPSDEEAATAMIGKSPNCYVQSFEQALSAQVYQEGDVIAIIDTVKIVDGNNVHIQGADGPPIQVIRYAGHHHELPAEVGVYRDPMIVVSGEDSYFTAQNIDFHGSAGAITKVVQRDANGDPVLDDNGLVALLNQYTYDGQTYTSDKQPDTNRAYGPIILIKDSGEVKLSDGTMVRHNWNAYGSLAGQTGADDLTAHPENMGAISITNDGKLILKGDVTIRDNLSHTMTNHDDVATPLTMAVENAPGNGAVYVDGGILVLDESHRSTAVDITQNRLMAPAIHDPNATISWWQMAYIEGKPSRYTIDNSVTETWQPANVYLTRTEPASLPADVAATQTYLEKHDQQSDNIVVNGALGTNTRVGVRKWFPGLETRDTIRFAVNGTKDPTVMPKAVNNNNNNFVSDDNFNIFYNHDVNTNTAYFFRCATFKHQWYVEGSHENIDPVLADHNLLLKSGNVLYFGKKENLCPTGGDSIIYRIEGGFMPYTYTWSDPVKGVELYSKTTPYSNTLVQYELKGALDENDQPTLTTTEERTAKYAASMADTLMLPYESMEAGQSRKWNHLRVTATDATGICTLYKDIDLRITLNNNTTRDQAISYMDDNTLTDNTTYTTPDTALTGVVTPVVADHANWKLEPSNGWTDTNRETKAIASRNFTGVTITPKVWVNRNNGTILASVSTEANVYEFVSESDYHELEGRPLCPGDTLYLYTEPESSTDTFIMWDFNPYYRPLARYIVPAHNATVTAYYGPKDYWYVFIDDTAKADAIYDSNFTYTNNNGHGFVNTYNGDIHIYNENGLAWFISRVNGLNGQQSRSFHYNRVLIHPNIRSGSNGVYDMKDHLWTPLGTEQHPFMGRFFGVGTDPAADLPYRLFLVNPLDDTDTTWVYDPSDPTNIPDEAYYEPIVIKNIIVNEPEMYSTGFFGYLDSAGIYNIEIQGTLVRGSQYVGGMAGTSSNSYVYRSAVYDSIDDARLQIGDKPTSILTSHYISGGLLGISDRDKIDGSKVQAKFVGDVVYSGGAIGYGTHDTVVNTYGYNKTNLQGLYLGGIAGYLDGDAPYNPSGIGRLFGGRKTGASPSVVQNNYFSIVSDGGVQRLGGVAGYAANTIIENNYVYGDLNGTNVGGVVAVAGNGTQADYNYYDNKSASQPTYRTQGNATIGHSASFEGEGNDVQMSSTAYGTTNLTHALNQWVREHNENGNGAYLTWRSAHEGENGGYPVFGTPDMIIVHGTDTIEGCNEVLYDGVTYYDNAMLTINVANDDQMVDSVVTLYIIVHRNTSTILTDSADVAEGYAGYGFNVTPTEAALLMSTIQAEGSARLLLTDTLQTVYGCDSIVTLMIIFTGTTEEIENVEMGPVDLQVYPNPTTDEVNVEAIGMSRVEIYDNEGRRLEDYTVDGDIFRLSLARYSSGMYYLRVHTPRGVTIQKVVKK